MKTLSIKTSLQMYTFAKEYSAVKQIYNDTLAI